MKLPETNKVTSMFCFLIIHYHHFFHHSIEKYKLTSFYQQDFFITCGAECIFKNIAKKINNIVL